MEKVLSPLVKKELANLNKDPDRRRTSMNVLKTYVELLDTKTIPLFLAEVSDSKQSKVSRQYAISLYEVLAKSHGKNIVPHISKIMGTVVKALSSSAGSLPLQEACGRVVLSIARYGIDPLSTETQREGIISGLCNPLLNALIGKVQPVAAGAALCLKALVESESWKFASNDMTNEVCSRVTAALEEKGTQTTAHMSLVCSLVKSNSQILQEYGRALIKAGIKILEDGVGSESSQQCEDAIQMINILLKYMDIGILGSELFIVVDNLDRCCSDRLPSLRDAVMEALQTAKIKASEKGLRDLVPCQEGRMPLLKSSPDPKFQRRRGLWCEADLSCGSSKTPTFGSQESYVVSYTPSSVSSKGSSNNFLCSSPSIRCNADQQNCKIPNHSVNKVRKHMQFENGGVDVSLRDGIPCMNTEESEVQCGSKGDTEKMWSRVDFGYNCEDSLKSSEKNISDDFDGFLQFDTVHEDEFARRNWRQSMLSHKDMSEREHAQKEAEKQESSQKNSYTGTSSFCWSRQHTPLKNVVTHRMPRLALTVEDFHIFTTPKKIIRSLQQSSPESACVKRQAMNEHGDDQYETPSEAEGAEVDDRAYDNVKGNVNVSSKGKMLFDNLESVCDEINGSNTLEGNTQERSSLRSSSVHKGDLLSSAISSSVCMDDKLEGELLGIKPVKVHKGCSGASHGRKSGLLSDIRCLAVSMLPVKAKWIGGNYIKWKKAKSSMQFILRGSIFAVLVLLAAIMAVKCLNVGEEHFLVPT